MIDKDHYINLRAEYYPEDLRLVIIAESPPASGKYFYNTAGNVTEPLFRALMHDILHISPRDKLEGLRAFRDAGMFLVDAVYQPVNEGYTEKQRNHIILDNYPQLKQDLIQIMRGNDVPILLIKVNVCRLLEPLLVQDDFRVLNQARRIPFPSSGNQGRFSEIVRILLKDSKAGFHPRTASGR